MIRRRILVGALLGSLFVLGWTVGRGRAAGDLYANLDVFVEVLHAVQTSYVDPVEPRPLIVGGLRGMMRELDPWSRYLDAGEAANLQRSLDESAVVGIGAQFDLHEGVPVVVAPVEGAPAWEAGLLPGDAIIEIDGHSTLGLNVPELAARLKGEAGTKVEVKVVRSGETSPRTLSIERRRLDTRSVPWAFMAEPGVGVVRLASISANAGAELAAAIDTLRAAGAKALVVDLRDNPGGLVEQAVAVVQQFVPAGTLVVSTHGRAAASDHRWVAAGRRAPLLWPVAVVVDGGTASSAEIVAGALQDLDRALVVGRTTFGKGAVQELLPLREGQGAIELTTAYYQTPLGRSLHRRERAPGDDEVDDGSDDAGPDSASADSAAHAGTTTTEVHTAAGRVVRGDGGIVPDVVVAPDSLTPLQRQVAQSRLAFRYAARPEAPRTEGDVDDATWHTYTTFLAGQGVLADPGALERERAPLALELRRELARRAGGAAAAARVAFAADPACQRAVAALRHAHSAREVFAFAGPAGTPPQARARARRSAPAESAPPTGLPVGKRR